jgi:hypothetical protein
MQISEGRWDIPAAFRLFRPGSRHPAGHDHHRNRHHPPTTRLTPGPTERARGYRC